jgi:DNA transposition AAA+ family ATPase
MSDTTTEQNIFEITYYENNEKKTGYIKSSKAFQAAQNYAERYPQRWKAEDLGPLGTEKISELRELDGRAIRKEASWITTGCMSPHA